MRCIKKGREPRVLISARKRIGSTPGVEGIWYDQLTSDERLAIKQQCLHEQGWLCGYTGLRVTMESSHLEHMYPQTQCSDEEQIDYNNLIACFNGADASNPGFGAKQKADWPSYTQRNKFIRPTEPICEIIFLYSEKGEIYCLEASDETGEKTPAQETICHLKLNHSELVQNREAALQTIKSLYKTRQVAKLEKRLNQLASRDAHGRFEQFAFQQYTYANDRYTKLKQKIKFARQQGNPQR